MIKIDEDLPLRSPIVGTEGPVRHKERAAATLEEAQGE
jgi:hypothetical protein